MSRNPHEPTEATRQTVQLHTTVGTDQETIARVLGIDAKTLRKYYRDELDLARCKANATIGGALFNKAKSGDTAAMIFWMKTQAGWKETVRNEHSGKIETEMSARDILASRISKHAAASGSDSDTGEPDGGASE